MNKTIGELERLSWHHYGLGVFLGLTFMSISVVNILFLKCFYNLRHLAFVRNSAAVISLIATDLVNAIILTPTLLSWFLLPPPNTYVTCVIKSLPFMMSNYTSLLNMTCFCICRSVLIKKIADGTIKVQTSKYRLATIGICTTALFGVSLPYIVWNNSDRVILDCRRSVFSDVNSALGVYSLLFDIPLIIMNVTFITLVVLFKKHQARVHDRCTLEHAQSLTTVKEGSVQSSVIWRRADKSTVFAQENRNEADRSSIKINTLTEHFAHERNVFDDDSSTIVSPNIFKINVLQVSEESPSYVATESNGESKFHETSTHSCNLFASKFTENLISTGMPYEKQMQQNNIHCQTEAIQSDTVDICKLEQQSIHPTDKIQSRHKKSEESRHFIQELKQSLVTMGILVAVYDVTVLPLIIDINMGAMNPNFLMPHVLNSFCFLNSFANPLIYLIRMKKMRQEMKCILRQCYNKIVCNQTANGG